MISLLFLSSDVWNGMKPKPKITVNDTAQPIKSFSQFENQNGIKIGVSTDLLQHLAIKVNCPRVLACTLQNGMNSDIARSDNY